MLAAVGLLREARIVARADLRPVASGGRADLLRQRLEAQAAGARAVLSLGVCGALAPDLKVGDVVIADAVASPGARRPVDAAWSARLADALPHARRGLIYASEAMIVSAADKARLHRDTRALSTDMESHVAAAFAAARGLPFAAVRVVSDSAAADLPRAVLAGMKPDGGMDLWGVLAALAADPRQLPALMRTGRDAEAAFRVLSTIAPRLSAPL